MRRRSLRSMVAAALVFPLGYTTVQRAAAVSQPQERLATGGLITSLLAAPVAGQPYSAVQVHSTIRSLADGSTVSHKGHHVVARDAEGRVHVELRMANGQNGEPDAVLIFVMDPVAHTLTTWLSGGPRNHASDHPLTASVFKIPAQQNQVPAVSAPHANPSESNRPQPIVTTEDLGTQTIQGVEASGKRITTILPVGRSGNSAPITKTHEIWTSADLQLVLKQEWNDPRSGKRIVALEKISRTDPDPALFRVPPGYMVKDAMQTLQELEQKLGETQN